MFYRRRLIKLQYILWIALMMGAFYLYLCIGKSQPEVISNQLNTAIIQSRQIADPFLVDDDVSNSMDPFPKFDIDSYLADGLNETLSWLDLWHDDAKCSKYQVKLLKKGSQPHPGALVSFPGSGNSWLRILLMGLTGVFAKSAYGGLDALFESKANATYSLPMDCGCSLLEKTHDFSLDSKLYNLHQQNRTKTLQQYKAKGILIIRNPYKAIKSYRNFDFAGMKGVAPETKFQGLEWDNFVSRSVAGWETLATVWIRGLKHGGVVYYERLLLHHQLHSELKRLIIMLGLNYEKDRLDCVLRHSKDNSFKRKSGRHHNPYTASQRLLIHKAIENVQLVLEERGLDPLPVQYYDLFDTIPEYGLGK